MAYSHPSSWISLEQYTQGVPDRAMVNELQPGVSYALMAKIKPNRWNLQAFMQPVKLNSVERMGELAVVHFTRLGSGLETDVDENGTFDDGFWCEAPTFRYCDMVGDQAYLSFDFSSFHDGLLREVAMERLPLDVLEPVWARSNGL
jgi:hypothetical protein